MAPQDLGLYLASDVAPPHVAEHPAFAGGEQRDEHECLGAFLWFFDEADEDGARAPPGSDWPCGAE